MNYIPFQNVSTCVVCIFLAKKYNPTLHKNQHKLVIHASLQQYLLLLWTIYIFLSFIVESTDRGLNLMYCSRANEIAHPIAKM